MAPVTRGERRRRSPGPEPARSDRARSDLSDPPDHAEWALDSVEALLAETGSGGSAVYRLCLLLVFTTVAALPLIEVPVTVQAHGALRPAVEKHEIRALRAGVLAVLPIQENQLVERGALIARLAAAGSAERMAALRAERVSTERLIGDVRRLTGPSPEAGPPPVTGRYRLALAVHLRAVEQQEARIRRIEREVGRTSALVARGALPSLLLDERSSALEEERSAGETIRREAQARWESELADLTRELDRIRGEEAVMRAEEALDGIRAPIRGTVEQVAALSPGSLVRAGDRIAVISPDTSLVAVVYAHEKVAGLIAAGAEVRMEVQAYPSSHWGVVTGRVAEIARDALIMDGRGVYPVVLSLDRRHLSLSSGARADLRKGMSVRAHFILARRSLWDLLRDDIDDWLNPARSGT
jgi:multidrug resistance efflux pump